MSFISILEAIGKSFLKGLSWAVKEAPAAATLVTLIFPTAGPAAAQAASVLTLIQNTVLLVEQKYAAQGQQSGTGAQKLADVLAVVQEVATDQLAKAGLPSEPDRLKAIVNAVVAILNASSASSTATAAA